MKNISNISRICSTAFTLAILFAFNNPMHLAAQGCPLTCNALTVVEVPANGTTELHPQDIAEGDLSVVCPGGILRAQAQINVQWQPAAGNMIFNTSHIGQTILCRILDEVTTNSCWGNVQIVAAPPPLDTIHFQLCARYWQSDRPMKGATLTFQPYNSAFPYSPQVFNLDPNQACTEVTVVLSDYLPGTTFSYSASLPDSGYLNGVNIMDLCKIAEHILGINPLPAPYAMFAADANKSGSITTFDLVEYRKLIMGIYTELPNNDSWRFISDYCTFPNPNNPFSNTCIAGISSTELAALDQDTAKVIGIKIGDVDGDVRLTGEAYTPPTASDSLTLLLPSGQLTAGLPVAIPVKFDKNFSLGNLQAQFFLDPSLVHYDSISDGLMDINTNLNAYYNPTTGRLKFLSTGYQSLDVPAGVPLFYIHLRPLQSTDLNAAMHVVHDDPNMRTIATGSNCSINYTIGSAYSGSVPTYSPELRGLRVQAPSPNPFAAQTFLTLELDRAETAYLAVIDLMGRVLFSEEKELSAGTYRWEIPASAVAPGGFGIWRLQVGGQMVSGKLTRL